MIGRTTSVKRSETFLTLQDGNIIRYLKIEQREKLYYKLYSPIDGRLDSIHEIPSTIEMDDVMYHLEDQYACYVSVIGHTPFFLQLENSTYGNFNRITEKLLRIEWQDGRMMMYEGEAVFTGRRASYTGNIRGHHYMIQRLFALILAVVFSVSALTGCISQRSTSGGTSSLAGYPLESVSQNGNQRSYVYRAANETVPQVARKFTEQHKPTQSSKEDNQQMFLVYSDELYSIQQDKDKPSDTLIEVSNKEFVQQNYSLSFFCRGIFLASILNDLFDFWEVIWRKLSWLYEPWHV
ncbi:hypothetical protein GCM10020331_043730 [Ectobacillus funiculus]